MDFKDYYQLLGVERDASQDDIKRAFRRLARKYHPDVSSESDADERFKEVGEAYEVLKDPEKREAYDQLGADWQSGQTFRPPPDWNEEFSSSGGGFTDHDQFSDFFESLFGRGQHRRETYSTGGFAAGGSDVHAHLEVTLEQLYGGVPIELALQVREPGHDGVMRSVVKRLKVTVPAGLGHGQSFRLKGQGNPGFGGAANGDLYVELRVAPHPIYTLDGRDISSEAAIMPWQAVLGGDRQIDTLGGPVSLKIGAGARAGDRLRLKGRGLQGNPPGDHYVTLKIDVPQVVTTEERNHYESLAELAEGG